MSDQNTLTWPRSSAKTTAGTLYANEQILALINRCIEGDETAYVALYNQFSAMIFRLNYSLLQNEEDAEEVLQDSFEYAFRRLKLYDARKSAFKTWLYRIAISRCRNKRRRKQLPSFSINHLIDGDLTDTETTTLDEVMELSDLQKTVWKALTELSTKLRETAVLRYYVGLSYAEIGEVLNIPAKTVESRMRLAHKALRGLLVDQEGNR